jgi:hypothetical protein
VKIYVAAVKAIRENERQDETQFTTKINDDVLSFNPLLNANVLLGGFLSESHPLYDQAQGSGAVFS